MEKKKKKNVLKLTCSDNGGNRVKKGGKGRGDGGQKREGQWGGLKGTMVHSLTKEMSGREWGGKTRMLLGERERSDENSTTKKKKGGGKEEKSI